MCNRRHKYCWNRESLIKSSPKIYKSLNTIWLVVNWHWLFLIWRLLNDFFLLFTFQLLSAGWSNIPERPNYKQGNYHSLNTIVTSSEISVIYGYYHPCTFSCLLGLHSYLQLFIYIEFFICFIMYFPIFSQNGLFL